MFSPNLKQLRNIVLIAGICLAAPVNGVIQAVVFDDPKLEARYLELIVEFRCLVCQNQSVADSDAELAQDVRKRTADLLKEGKSDEEIRAFMQSRFGDFVLYRTPMRGANLIIWVVPLVVVVGGVIGFFVVVRRRSNQEGALHVEVDSLEQAQSLLTSQERGDQEQTE